MSLTQVFVRERAKERERAYRIRPLGVTVLSRIHPAPLAQTRALTHCNKMVSRRAIYCSRSLGLAFSLSWQHREGPVLHWVPLCRDGWLMAEATALELLTKSNFSQRRQSWPQLWLPSSFLEPSCFICPKLQTRLLFFFFFFFFFKKQTFSISPPPKKLHNRRLVYKV